MPKLLLDLRMEQGLLLVVIIQLVFLAVGDSNDGLMLRKERSPVEPEMYSLHFHTEVRYRYARTVVSSKLVNPVNQSGEVTFTVVLPNTAFISDFVIEVEEKKYKAYVKSKEEAENEYKAAVQRGQTAGHISARNSNKFMVSVNVEAQGKVNFNLTYEELLTRKLGLYEHAININPGQIVQDLSVDVHIQEGVELTFLHVPEFRQTAEVKQDAKESENSLAVIEQPQPMEAHIWYQPTPEQQQVQNKEAGIKGQFVVQYDVQRRKDAGEIQVTDDYFVHYFAPEALPPMRKHVVFVLDISGSMYGRKIEQTKNAMDTILDEVHEEDFFNVILFSDNIREWSPKSFDSDNLETSVESQKHAYLASKTNIKKAKKYLGEMSASGGTNIYDALHHALGLTEDIGDVDAEPIIIFLTDGEPTVGITDTHEIIASVTAANTESNVAIFSLSFGQTADFHFLKRLSLRNNGFARKIYEASDAAFQLYGFYREIGTPLLSDIIFNYATDVIDAESVTQTEFHAYYEGGEIVVAGRLQGHYTPEFSAEVKAMAADGPYDSDTVIALDSSHGKLLPGQTDAAYNDRNLFLEREWAYLTIQDLLKRKEIEEERVNGALNGEQETDTKISGLKDRALDLALHYGFVTPLTSLVVVKPEETVSATATDADEECCLEAADGVNPKVQVKKTSVHLPTNSRASATLNAVFIRKWIKGGLVPHHFLLVVPLQLALILHTWQQ